MSLAIESCYTASLPHLLRLRSYLTSGKKSTGGDAAYCVAGMAGRVFANSTNPSCVEMEHTVKAQLAHRKVYTQHGEAVLADARQTQRFKSPTSEQLSSTRQYLVLPSSQAHPITLGVKHLPER